MEQIEKSKNVWQMTLYGLVGLTVILLALIVYQLVQVNKLTKLVYKEQKFLTLDMQSLSQEIQQLQAEESRTPEGMDTVSTLVHDLGNKNGVQITRETPRTPEGVSDLVQENSTQYVYGRVSKDKFLPMLVDLERLKKGLTIVRLQMEDFDKNGTQCKSASFTAHWYSPKDKP